MTRNYRPYGSLSVEDPSGGERGGVGWGSGEDALRKRGRSVQPYRTGQVRTGQVRAGQVRTGQVRKEQVRTGQVRTGQVRTGQDRTGQDGTVALRDRLVARPG